MSLKSFITGIFAAIAKLFHSLQDEVKNDILPAAIAVTNTLKTITDFDSTNLIGRLAGTAGVVIEEKLKQLLPGIVKDLQLAQQFASLSTADEILAAVVKYVGQSNINVKTAFWIEFSAKVTQALVDGLTLSEAMGLSQWFYAHQPDLQAQTTDESGEESNS